MIRNVIFDFDGVMVDSNEIRNDGFRSLYASASDSELSSLMEYVRHNHGLSRYNKIRHYYEQIKGQAANEEIIRRNARQYSLLVMELVVNAQEIPGARAFLDEFSKDLNFALISSSDQTELREICRRRDIDGYFVDILGSPEEKSVNIRSLVNAQGWNSLETVYVGDSMNDRDAAYAAGIAFIGFGSNNFPEMEPGLEMIDRFQQLPSILLGLGDGGHAGARKFG